MPEQQCPDGAGKKRDAEGEERIQRLRCRIAAGEKHRAYHHRHGQTVDVEIVKFDGGADEARECDAGGGEGRR